MKVTAIIPPTFIVCILLIHCTCGFTASADVSRKSRRGIAPSNGTESVQVKETKVHISQDATGVHETRGGAPTIRLSSDAESTENVLSAWSAIESYSSEYINRLIGSTLTPILEELFITVDVSIGCQSAIRTVLKDASRMQKYALQSKCRAKHTSTHVI